MTSRNCEAKSVFTDLAISEIFLQESRSPSAEKVSSEFSDGNFLHNFREAHGIIDLWSSTIFSEFSESSVFHTPFLVTKKDRHNFQLPGTNRCSSALAGAGLMVEQFWGLSNKPVPTLLFLREKEEEAEALHHSFPFFHA